MDGGKDPVRDGDYLLLEHMDSAHAGSITGDRLVIERQDASGDDQYLLRLVTKDKEGKYILKAANPKYEDLVATDEMLTRARLKEILDPLELMIGSEILREDIPKYFGEVFIGKVRTRQRLRASAGKRSQTMWRKAWPCICLRASTSFLLGRARRFGITDLCSTSDTRGALP
jgi:hypothetical protein